jgi:hypothetical protein
VAGPIDILGPEDGGGRARPSRRAPGRARAARERVAEREAEAKLTSLGPAEREPTPPALRLLNVGYGNLVAISRVVAIVSPQSSPMRRLREEASSRGKLVDATQGRRTRSILVTDSDHVVLSALNPETIAARLAPDTAGDEGDA